MKFTIIFSAIFLISSLLYSLFFIPTASAHLVGQPPFFKINGVYSNLYPVPLTSLENFGLPQDLAPENYLINQPISMEFDLAKLPAPPEVIAKTKFNWDYGDGSHGSGLKNTHAYSRMGSYIMIIYADDGSTPTPQIIQSTMLHILPSKNYQLPKSVIKINNQKSKDPLTDILRFKFSDGLHFDASESNAPSSKIVSYLWDFGDRSSDTTSTITHSYPGDLSQIFPVLRVKDANGFIADSFVEVENGLYTNNQYMSPNVNSTPNDSNGILKRVQDDRMKKFGIWILGFGILTAAIVIMVRRLARGRGRGRR